MDQHDREYPTIQDAVTHAGRLWQTLDKDKIRQEIKEEKERTHQQHENSDQQSNQQDNSFWPHRQTNEQQSSQQNL